MVTVLIFDAVTISWRRVKQTRVLGLVFRRKEKQIGEMLGRPPATSVGGDLGRCPRDRLPLKVGDGSH